MLHPVNSSPASVSQLGVAVALAASPRLLGSIGRERVSRFEHPRVLLWCGRLFSSRLTLEPLSCDAAQPGLTRARHSLWRIAVCFASR
jgi:hypothetical protein